MGRRHVRPAPAVPMRALALSSPRPGHQASARQAPARRSQLVVLRLAGWLVLFTSCYSPRLGEGAPCTSDESCPTPQRCLGGFCRAEAPSDAPVIEDALAIDAPSSDAAPIDAIASDAALIDAPPID